MVLALSSLKHLCNICTVIFMAVKMTSDEKSYLSISNTFLYMSRVVRKPALCICENKDADQLRGNHEADQHLCFRFIDSTIPLLPKSKISSLYLFLMAVQPGLCGTRSKNQKTAFLTTIRLIFKSWLHHDGGINFMGVLA